MARFFASATPALLLMLSSARAQSCEQVLEDSISVKIANDLGVFMDAGTEALPTFDDQINFMGYTGIPNELNDLSPPHYQVKFNSVKHIGGSNNYFTGYESGGEFIGYYPMDGYVRWRPAADYNESEIQRYCYLYNPITGEATDAVPDKDDVYDPRIRGWYKDAKAACSADLQGVYSCPLHWTDPYIFKANGKLGITPALGFLDYSNDGKSVLGVTAFGLALEEIDKILVDAVGSSIGLTAFVMERNGNLIGTSSGDPVTVLNSAGDLERLNAQESENNMISSSSSHILSNHYRSDQFLVHDGNVISVRNYLKDDQIHWYIVVVDETASSDCIAEINSDDISLSMGDVDHFLSNVKGLGDMTAYAYTLGLLSTFSPTTIDEEDTLQEFMFSVFKNSQSDIRSMYVGYEVGTFLSITRAGDVISLRPPDSSTDTTRFYYDYDLGTGKTDGAPFASKVYDPRERPWYQEAKAAGTGIFSSVFVFATGGDVGITYSVPVYDSSNDLVCVVGVDFALDTIDKILTEHSEPGFGIYLMETEATSADDAYNMLASSCNAVIADSDLKVQSKAYNVTQVEDYYISTSAMHLKDNRLTADHTGELETLSYEVKNLEKYNLHWRFVSYSSTLSTSTSDTSTSTSSEDDDEAKMAVALSAVILAILIVAVIALGAALMSLKKNQPAAATESKTSGDTKNPIADKL